MRVPCTGQTETTDPFGDRKLSPEAQARLDDQNRLFKLAHEHLIKGEYERATAVLGFAVLEHPRLRTQSIVPDALIRVGRVADALPFLRDYASVVASPNSRATLYGYTQAVLGNLREAKVAWEWYLTNTLGTKDRDFSDWPGLQTQANLISTFALATASDIQGDDLGRAFYIAKALDATPKNAIANLLYASYTTYPPSMDPKFYRDRVSYAEIAEKNATTEVIRERARDAKILLLGTAYRLERAIRKR